MRQHGKCKTLPVLDIEMGYQDKTKYTKKSKQAFPNIVANQP